MQEYHKIEIPEGLEPLRSLEGFQLDLVTYSPLDPRCKAKYKPHIVWFRREKPARALHRVVGQEKLTPKRSSSLPVLLNQNVGDLIDATAGIVKFRTPTSNMDQTRAARARYASLRSFAGSRSSARSARLIHT